MTPDDLMFRPDALRGQRILVTGGGSGLGRVMTEACVMLGAHVYICGRRGGVLADTAAALCDVHDRTVTPIACDIRSPEAIHDMMDEIWAEGALTGLVNNAAGNFISRTEDVSPKGFDAIASIVFRGSFLVTLDAGKRWLAGGDRASVVSIVTTWVWSGGPFTVPSAMSKAGMNAMTQSLATEWGGRGVRLNAVAPGLFPTEGAFARLKPGAAMEGGGPAPDPGPLGRPGEMRELANLIVYLLHPLSEFVNGQTIAIDGGAWNAGISELSGLRTWDDARWEEAREMIRGADKEDRARRTV